LSSPKDVAAVPTNHAGGSPLPHSNAPCVPTDDHVEGPFYRPGAPESTDLYPKDSKGPILHFRGRVTDTNLVPLPGIHVEIWHADDAGRYDNDNPASLPPPTFFQCRGRLTTASDGTFKVRTVVPGNYRVDPESDWVRVKHLHFKVYGLGFVPLTTEIELLPDRYAPTDQLFDPKLAAQLENLPREDDRDAYHAYFNFVIVRISPIAYARQAARRRPAG
jgi:protocatechuate 3,4-dioxygenase beta subunit